MMSTAFGGPGPLFLLLLALGIDAVLGAWLGRVLPDVAGLTQRLCAVLDRRLNRPDRREKDRLLRGALVMLVLLAVAAAAGWVVETLAAGGSAIGTLLTLLVLLASLRGGMAAARVRAVRHALEQPGIEGARAAVTGLTRRYIHAMDTHAIARAAIEHAARSVCRKTVAPAFWFILLGVPGLLMWCVVDGADAAIGRAGPRHERFGLTAARLDDALNALPARLAGLLLALAAPFTGGSPGTALRTLGTDARLHSSLNMGWPLAGMAGALDLALAGPHKDGGVTVNDPWVGRGRARATPADIKKAQALGAVATLLLAGLVGVLMVGVARL